MGKKIALVWLKVEKKLKKRKYMWVEQIRKLEDPDSVDLDEKGTFEEVEVGFGVLFSQFQFPKIGNLEESESDMIKKNSKQCLSWRTLSVAVFFSLIQNRVM